MKAVMYGAGNIGRGFIGALFSRSGYTVTFVDVAEKVVAALHNEHRYPVRIVSNDGYEDMEVKNVDAINGGDGEAVAEAIAAADIMATAVGVNVLKFIIPNLVAGIRRRFSTADRPLNILICENLMDANKILGQILKEQLTAEECRLFDERIGLVEASIGRMVPVQTPQDGNVLRVCVEQYDYLPVDKEAIKGEIPALERLVPVSPFDFYLKRKLYIHNLGHSICAYLGLYTGEIYIYEAVDNPHILIIVRNAMQESMTALASEYDAPIQEILRHIDDLLLRFTNKALGDTCARVGQDPRRKLGPTDRLIGAAKLCQKHGGSYAYITAGIAAALHRFLMEAGRIQSKENALAVLGEVSGLAAGEPLTDAILDMYAPFISGTNPRLLRHAAEKTKRESLVNVI
jgi:mannitol-1-phosphate 5-dehydrogenase